MNSSRTHFGRISIKAKLSMWGENGVWIGPGAYVASERLLKAMQANERTCAVRRERASTRRGSERKGLRVHSANGSRRPRSETAFRATLDWFWRSRAAFLEVGSGHFRFYVTPLSLSFSYSLPFSFFHPRATDVLRVCNWLTPRRRIYRTVAVVIGAD